MRSRRELIGAVAGAVATGPIASLAAADSNKSEFIRWHEDYSFLHGDGIVGPRIA